MAIDFKQNRELLDGAGYPTKQALRWLLTPTSPRQAIQTLVSMWNTEYGQVSPNIKEHERETFGGEFNSDHIRLVTGGWSGNEEALATFELNTVAHMMTWRLSTRGGLHIFEVPSWLT